MINEVKYRLSCWDRQRSEQVEWVLPQGHVLEFDSPSEAMTFANNAIQAGWSGVPYCYDEGRRVWIEVIRR